MASSSSSSSSSKPPKRHISAVFVGPVSTARPASDRYEEERKYTPVDTDPVPVGFITTGVPPPAATSFNWDAPLTAKELYEAQFRPNMLVRDLVAGMPIANQDAIVDALAKHASKLPASDDIADLNLETAYTHAMFDAMGELASSKDLKALAARTQNRLSIEDVTKPMLILGPPARPMIADRTAWHNAARNDKLNRIPKTGQLVWQHDRPNAGASELDNGLVKMPVAATKEIEETAVNALVDAWGAGLPTRTYRQIRAMSPDMPDDMDVGGTQTEWSKVVDHATTLITAYNAMALAATAEPAAVSAIEFTNDSYREDDADFMLLEGAYRQSVHSAFDRDALLERVGTEENWLREWRKTTHASKYLDLVVEATFARANKALMTFITDGRATPMYDVGVRKNWSSRYVTAPQATNPDASWLQIVHQSVLVDAIAPNKVDRPVHRVLAVAAAACSELVRQSPTHARIAAVHGTSEFNGCMQLLDNAENVFAAKQITDTTTIVLEDDAGADLQLRLGVVRLIDALADDRSVAMAGDDSKITSAIETTIRARQHVKPLLTPGGRDLTQVLANLRTEVKVGAVTVMKNALSTPVSAATYSGSSLASALLEDGSCADTLRLLGSVHAKSDAPWAKSLERPVAYALVRAAFLTYPQFASLERALLFEAILTRPQPVPGIDTSATWPLGAFLRTGFVDNGTVLAVSKYTGLPADYQWAGQFILPLPFGIDAGRANAEVRTIADGVDVVVATRRVLMGEALWLRRPSDAADHGASAIASAAGWSGASAAAAAAVSAARAAVDNRRVQALPLLEQIHRMSAIEKRSDETVQQLAALRNLFPDEQKDIPDNAMLRAITAEVSALIEKSKPRNEREKARNENTELLSNMNKTARALAGLAIRQDFDDEHYKTLAQKADDGGKDAVTFLGHEAHVFSSPQVLDGATADRFKFLQSVLEQRGNSVAVQFYRSQLETSAKRRAALEDAKTRAKETVRAKVRANAVVTSAAKTLKGWEETFADASVAKAETAFGAAAGIVVQDSAAVLRRQTRVDELTAQLATANQKLAAAKAKLVASTAAREASEGGELIAEGAKVREARTKITGARESLDKAMGDLQVANEAGDIAAAYLDSLTDNHANVRADVPSAVTDIMSRVAQPKAWTVLQKALKLIFGNTIPREDVILKAIAADLGRAQFKTYFEKANALTSDRLNGMSSKQLVSLAERIDAWPSALVPLRDRVEAAIANRDGVSDYILRLAKQIAGAEGGEWVTYKKAFEAAMKDGGTTEGTSQHAAKQRYLSVEMDLTRETVGKLGPTAIMVVRAAVARGGPGVDKVNILLAQSRKPQRAPPQKSFFDPDATESDQDMHVVNEPPPAAEGGADDDETESGEHKPESVAPPVDAAAREQRKENPKKRAAPKRDMKWLKDIEDLYTRAENATRLSAAGGPIQRIDHTNDYQTVIKPLLDAAEVAVTEEQVGTVKLERLRKWSERLDWRHDDSGGAVGPLKLQVEHAFKTAKEARNAADRDRKRAKLASTKMRRQIAKGRYPGTVT